MSPGQAVIAFVLASSAAWAQGLVVHPSGPTLPSNALRLSVTFDRRPAADPTLALTLAPTGAALPPGAEAFVRPYLWTADGRTLTVLFDPARLKTGVGANEALGRVLRPGGRVVLTLDGRTLKSWRVAAAVTRPPDPSRWTLAAPATAGSRAPIRIAFDRPVDALSRDLIAIVAPSGAAVPGSAVLEDGELVWRFVPEVTWVPGRYRIAVSPALEDPSGNAIAGAFEAASGTGSVGGPRLHGFDIH